MQQLSPTDDPYGSRVAVDQVRLFRRDPALRWEYRVHEQILTSIRRAGHDLRRTDVVIGHSGFQTRAQSDEAETEPGTAPAAGCRAAGRPDHAVSARPGESATGPRRRSLADPAPKPGADAPGLFDPPPPLSRRSPGLTNRWARRPRHWRSAAQAASSIPMPRSSSSWRPRSCTSRVTSGAEERLLHLLNVPSGQQTRRRRYGPARLQGPAPPGGGLPVSGSPGGSGGAMAFARGGTAPVRPGLASSSANSTRPRDGGRSWRK